MTDDAIGIIVTEKLKDWLVKENFEVIIGETDVEYYMSFINKEDLIIFIDAKYEGCIPGEVSMSDIYTKNSMSLTSQHDRYFLNPKCEKINGYIIGIEVAYIKIGIGLSDLLNKEMLRICEQVKQYIKLIEYNSTPK